MEIWRYGRKTMTPSLAPDVTLSCLRQGLIRTLDHDTSSIDDYTDSELIDIFQKEVWTWSPRVLRCFVKVFARVGGVNEVSSVDVLESAKWLDQVLGAVELILDNDWECVGGDEARKLLLAAGYRLSSQQHDVVERLITHYTSSFSEENPCPFSS